VNGGPIMAPLLYEHEKARRLGIDIHETRASIRACWDHSDNGRSFVAALADKGLVLARGERRGFIVVDPADGMHALRKRILGHTAEEVRARLSDIDRQKLPTVEQAREQLGAEHDWRRRTRLPATKRLNSVMPVPCSKRLHGNAPLSRTAIWIGR
jgi:hypothetical protein